MASVNKVILVGGVTKDVELRQVGQRGLSVAKFSLATTESFGKGSDRQDKTTYHNIVVWGKQGEACAQYLQKGSQVYLEGRIENRSYDGNDGTKKYISEVVAEKVQFLGGGPKSGSAQGEMFGGGQGSDEDVPF